MTAPLFDIKSHFSEYVTYAEKGEVVEITKHGRATAVIISIKEYESLQKNYKPSFIEQVNKWKAKTGGLTAEEYEDFESALARNQENYPTESVF